MEEKAKLEIIAQKLENKRKRLEIVEAQKELLLTDKKMIIEQIKNLRDLLTETVIDDEKTIFTTEPRYRLVFNGVEIEKLKEKIWHLLDKI